MKKPITDRVFDRSVVSCRKRSEQSGGKKVHGNGGDVIEIILVVSTLVFFLTLKIHLN